MENDSDNTVYFSRIAYIFVIFSIVSSGYVAEILSCQMRYVFETSLFFRHFVGILMIFVLIMTSGGWSFNKELDDKAPTNWSNGNAIDTMIMALCIYLIFLLSSKSRFLPNILFFSMLLLLYLINTQCEFWNARQNITYKTNKILLNIEYILSGMSGITLLYGFIDYIIYQKQEYGKRFSWIHFILGGHKCHKIK